MYPCGISLKEKNGGNFFYIHTLVLSYFSRDLTNYLISTEVTIVSMNRHQEAAANALTGKISFIRVDDPMELMIRNISENELEDFLAILMEAALWLKNEGKEMWKDNQLSPENL